MGNRCLLEHTAPIEWPDINLLNSNSFHRPPACASGMKEGWKGTSQGQWKFRFSIFFVSLTKVRVQLFQIIRHSRA